MSEAPPRIHIENTRPERFAAVRELSARVYPDEPPWAEAYLARHRERFPEGQWLALDREADDQVVGMAASLIVAWEDYDRMDRYGDMTAGGTFDNHDPSGRTLYGAEVMTHPERRRMGIGGKLYAVRRELCCRLGLMRIRAGARIPDYHHHAHEMTAVSYVQRVIRGELHDPTLSFQLHQGFDVIAVVPNYQRLDEESQGYGVLIEWMNPEVATPRDTAARDPRFRRPV